MDAKLMNQGREGCIYTDKESVEQTAVKPRKADEVRLSLKSEKHLMPKEGEEHVHETWAL